MFKFTFVFVQDPVIFVGCTNKISSYICTSDISRTHVNMDVMFFIRFIDLQILYQFYYTNYQYCHSYNIIYIIIILNFYLMVIVVF